ncbi:AAA family ATPase [Pseudonocardia yuanmonensis]|uniref:MinD/ParA family ATP-binding protein n=1 Tax=Pseudonocardia yuanmonensis TaxID=1095914 RepID=UPI003CD067AD
MPNGSLPNGASGNGDVPRAAAPNGAAPAQPRDRGAQPRGEASPPPAPPQWRTAGQRPAGERSADERTAGERTAGERTAGERTAGERTAGERTAGERPVGERAGAERPRERRVVPQEGRTPPRGMPLGPPTGPNRPIRDVGRWTDPGAVAAQEAQQARADSDADLADLSTARLLKPGKRRPPRTGWRRFLYLLTGRLINPGESPQDIRERELTTRINQPLLGCHKIATLSLKGGVGKTTITATLGATFASLRGDRVVAVDANPDRGTLSQKIPLETSATVRHLLRDAQRIRRYTDVRAYTSQGPSRLEVLASEQDPAVSEAFSEDDYRRTVTLLEHFYNIVLTDCGTGLMHSAMYGVLGVADQLIIVSSGSIDGARSASATMDWLEAHDHGDLVRNAVAVINNVHRQAGAVDLERVAQHFAGRCRAVVQIPFDPHLEEGAEVDLERLSPPTRLALLELAASVADGFPS